MASSVRRWATGVGFVGGAVVVAALIAPTAYADDLSTDIGLLTTSETDVNDGLTALSQLPGVGGGTPPAELGVLIGQFEAVQTPLLSADNSFESGLGELLFNGPDQQLAQSSETFLSAADAYAADPTSLTNTADVLSATFQWADSLLFDSLPANVIGQLTDSVLGYDIASPGAATELATNASSAAATPDDVIGQAITDLNQGTSLLDTASTADLSARAAIVLSNQESLPAQFDVGLTNFSSLQDMLSAGDQTLLADVDEQMVSAAQNILSADQAFVAADQAGDLSNNSLLPVEWTVLGADLQFGGAAFNAFGATLLAAFTGGLDTSSAADLASSLDPATAIDPSIFTDVLSSIGL
jgi:hypothetical protein